MGVQHPSNSLGTVLCLKVSKKLEANVFKFFDSPKMSFVSQPGHRPQSSLCGCGSHAPKCCSASYRQSHARQRCGLDSKLYSLPSEQHLTLESDSFYSCEVSL